MPAELNHTIIHASDKHASAEFLAGILDVPVQPPWGPFVPVTVANGVTLDFVDATAVTPQHYAFLVNEDEFDRAYGRLLDAHAPTWADPARTRPAEINHHYGGRGIYFDDPDGHLMEILTQPDRPQPPSTSDTNTAASR